MGAINGNREKLERKNARKWYNEGEMSNRYFFNLLNHKIVDERNEMMVGDNLTNNIEDINRHITGFYRDLYENDEVIDNNDISDDNVVFFRNIDKVNELTASGTATVINLGELESTLNTCKDSAPGPDGIPYSYYKALWSWVGNIILQAWHFSTRTGQLAPSHKIPRLKLIPNVRKDLNRIENWRPITLSNIDFKLITKMYSLRLTQALDSVIGHEQTAYIPGRMINENIRALIRTVETASESKIDGMLISLDERKAFDSVSHNYVRKCLRAGRLHPYL